MNHLLSCEFPPLRSSHASNGEQMAHLIRYFYSYVGLAIFVSELHEGLPPLSLNLPSSHVFHYLFVSFYHPKVPVETGSVHNLMAEGLAHPEHKKFLLSFLADYSVDALVLKVTDYPPLLEVKLIVLDVLQLDVVPLVASQFLLMVLNRAQDLAFLRNVLPEIRSEIEVALHINSVMVKFGALVQKNGFFILIFGHEH